MISPFRQIGGNNKFKVTSIPLSKLNPNTLYDLTVNRLVQLYGSNETHTDFLNKVGRMLFNKKYVGTFPQDKAILDKKGTYYQIINTDLSNESGTHWVALVNTPDTIYVYDSYGRDTRTLLPFLYSKVKNKKIKIIDSRNDPEQTDIKEDKNTCGQRCLAFLWVVEKLGIKEAIKI